MLRSPDDISPGDADISRWAEQAEPVYAAALVTHPGHGLRGVQRQAGQGGGEGDREQEIAWIVIEVHFTEHGSFGS